MDEQSNYPQPNGVAAATTSIKDPAPNDCLFGRGRRFQNHPGNRNLHRLVDERLDAFVAAKCDGKNLIIGEVFDIIRHGEESQLTPPGRFLKRGNGLAVIGDEAVIGWEEVTDDEARAKVGHTFRSRIRGGQRQDSPKQATSNARQSGQQTGPQSNGGLIPSAIAALARGGAHTGQHHGALAAPPIPSQMEVPLLPPTQNDTMNPLIRRDDSMRRLVEEEMTRRRRLLLEETIRQREHVKRQIIIDILEARNNRAQMMQMIPLQFPLMHPPSAHSLPPAVQPPSPAARPLSLPAGHLLSSLPPDPSGNIPSARSPNADDKPRDGTPR